MGRLRLLVLAVVLLSTTPALAGEPPNQNDPCSRDGRNVCGTTGAGFYDNYRYGVRWFGDYRGAVANVARTFCIDLRFWYPSKAMKFELTEPDQLKNRDGDVVTFERQRRMAYATWTFGRTNSANQQAAVMLYVHSQMVRRRAGRGRPRCFQVGPALHLRTGRARLGAPARPVPRCHWRPPEPHGRRHEGDASPSVSSPSRVPPSPTSGSASPEAGWPGCPVASKPTTAASRAWS